MKRCWLDYTLEKSIFWAYYEAIFTTKDTKSTKFGTFIVRALLSFVIFVVKPIKTIVQASPHYREKYRNIRTLP